MHNKTALLYLVVFLVLYQKFKKKSGQPKYWHGCCNYINKQQHLVF